MSLPWNDWVTATIDGDSRREIITEGTLRAVVEVLAKKPVSDLRRIVIAFPDRRSPPYRIPGEQVGALALHLATGEQVLGFAAGESPRARRPRQSI